jgi:MscS family membrane protein
MRISPTAKSLASTARAVRMLLVLLLALAFAGPADAARTPHANSAPQSDAAGPPRPASFKAHSLEFYEELEGRYDSPRQAVAAFYTAAEDYAVFEVDALIKERLLELALSTFEFEGDRSDGEHLVLQLLGILDRLEGANLLAFPGSAEVGLSGPDVNSWALTKQVGDGQVSLGFQLMGQGTADARWLFSRETLDRVPAIARRLSDQPVLERVRDRRTREAKGRHWLQWARYELRSNMPEGLLGKGFLLENWQWIAIALLVFLGLILDRIVSFFMKRVVVRFLRSERMSTSLPSDELANFERPFGLFVIGWFVGRAIPLLSLESIYETMLITVAGLVAVFAGVWATYRLIDVVASVLQAKARLTQNTFDDLLVPLLRRTAKIVITILGLVYLASRISEDFYGVVAGLSIGSLAVGFAAKDSIENLFGTFTVLLDKPFGLGDWITVGEIDGTVEDVGFRSTRVRTFYNSLISVPNSTFIKAHVDNWGSRRYRRIKTTLALTYDTPPTKIEAFCEAVRQLIRDHPYTRKDYYHVYLNGFGDSSLDVLLYCFVETPDWSTELREKHRLFNDILRVASELGVDFAFPTQSIHVVRPEDLEHANTPPDAARGEELGRETGRKVVASGLERYDGSKPPPVVID